MGDFAAPKLAKVRCAFIGVGARGSGHVSQIASIEGTEVVAICDLNANRAQTSEAKAKGKGHNPKVYHSDADAWKKCCWK
jgi:predicted homoserine dehydrogenase-like protein